MFWDREAAEIFLETHYPWFISTFKSYPKTVQQGASLHLSSSDTSDREGYLTQ